MNSPKIKIIGSKQDISLDGNDFMNFRYIEDINQGFPIIEFALRDNLYTLLREGLFGDEELIIQEFENDQFKFIDKSFKIKSIGSGGESPKPATAQTVKLIAIDKNYDSILKNQSSIYFLPTEKQKISDLIQKFLDKIGIQETENFQINIEPTAPLLDQGFQNVYIPYSRNAMSMIRKFCNYAVTIDGLGAFTFFINRKGLNFTPISKLFKEVTDKTPYLLITDAAGQYGINNLKLSTFNAFSNFIIGHEKQVMGFNLLEKEYNIINYKSNSEYIEHSQYIDKPKTFSNIKTMGVSIGSETKSIPFSKDFMNGNIKTYYTPLDNPLALKGYADKLYYSQMLNYVLEINLNMTSIFPDFAIGEMVNIEFKTTDADSWAALNGGWFLKSFAYTYPGDDVILKLVRIGIGTLPEQYIKVGEH